MNVITDPFWDSSETILVKGSTDLFSVLSLLCNMKYQVILDTTVILFNFSNHDIW